MSAECDNLVKAAERVTRVYRGLANDENDGEFALWSETDLITAILALDQVLLSREKLVDEK